MEGVVMLGGLAFLVAFSLLIKYVFRTAHNDDNDDVLVSHNEETSFSWKRVIIVFAVLAIVVASLFYAAHRHKSIRSISRVYGSEHDLYELQEFDYNPVNNHHQDPPTDHESTDYSSE